MKRRKVLKRLGASAVAASVLSGTATADGPGYEQKYRQKPRRMQAVEEYASGVLDELSARGIVEEASVAAFEHGTEADWRDLAPDRAVDAWAVNGYTDPEREEPTAHLKLSKSTDTHDLTLHVRPELSEAYALVSPKDDGETFAIDPSTESVKLTASSQCEDFCDCSTRSCSIITNLNWAYQYDCYKSYDRCHCYMESEECGCDPLVGC